jgi:hypothetical protein
MPDTGGNEHHFEFDLDRGIRSQVVEKLESNPLLPLSKGVGPQLSGIYALYFKDNLVYIGKASKGTTKSKRTLRGRLAEHIGKIGTPAKYHTRRYDVPLFYICERMVGIRG